MKITFVKLMAVAAGMVVGVGLLGIGLYWATHRSPRWDSHAITAKLKRYDLFVNTDKPEEHHYYANLYFDVTNNTSRDYTLPVEAYSKHLMEQQSGSLLGSSGWEVSLAQGSMPYKVPADFFEPKPIFVPSHTTVQICFVNDSAYDAKHVAEKTKEQVAEQNFEHVDELVILDDAARYQIHFPIKNFWKSAHD